MRDSPYNKIPVLDDSVKGIILSGSPCSVRDANSPSIDLTLFGDRPVLGICYGAQLLAHLGVVLCRHLRIGNMVAPTWIRKSSALLSGLSAKSQVWMSHGDTIMELPTDYEVIGSTETVRVAAFSHISKPIFGIQFHPEVTHSTEGGELIKNFVVGISGCSQTWTSDSFAETSIAALKEKLGNDKVVLGLSGESIVRWRPFYCTGQSVKICIASLSTMDCCVKMSLNKY